MVIWISILKSTWSEPSLCLDKMLLLARSWFWVDLSLWLSLPTNNLNYVVLASTLHTQSYLHTTHSNRIFLHFLERLLWCFYNEICKSFPRIFWLNLCSNPIFSRDWNLSDSFCILSCLQQNTFYFFISLVFSYY